MRFWKKDLTLYIIKVTGLFYQTPSNLSYWWNFGAFAFYFLLLQIITGIFLGMAYNPEPTYAYASITFINNEVYYGWWLRALHANGASFFFFSVYIHFFKGLYFSSFMYPRQLLWISGVFILILMIFTAFLGYILPWGQMSFWAAMVITSLLSGIPLIGLDLVYLLWGSFSIEDVTLYRFYALHYAFPFVILFVTFVHFILLHSFGSSNPLGLSSGKDYIPFSPYFVLKDILSLVLINLVLIYIISISPDFFAHSINYEMASPLITPPHIVPEWYLLFFYAILRSITNKLLGFTIMICSLLVLFFLPFFSKTFIIQSPKYRPLYVIFFWILVAICLLLGWIGGLPVMTPYIITGQILTFFYFFFLIVIFPLIGIIERIIYIILVRNSSFFTE